MYFLRHNSYEGNNEQNDAQCNLKPSSSRHSFDLEQERYFLSIRPISRHVCCVVLGIVFALITNVNLLEVFQLNLITESDGILVEFLTISTKAVCQSSHNWRTATKLSKKWLCSVLTVRLPSGWQRSRSITFLFARGVQEAPMRIERFYTHDDESNLEIFLRSSMELNICRGQIHAGEHVANSRVSHNLMSHAMLRQKTLLGPNRASNHNTKRNNCNYNCYYPIHPGEASKETQFFLIVLLNVSHTNVGFLFGCPATPPMLLLIHDCN
mmetsp:Transcript_68832/g.125584  ORF Transcript_68832/g.125584 Transcript_68832/m.125584 type:complete len:268 (-) Transcript_68832:562-1365(-)